LGVRSSTFDTVMAVDPDEQLSTGEAAKLLNSSRQHVVDLCEKGLLPFTTVGTHRRVRRGDVDAIRHRTDRLTQDEQRSLWLAYAVAGRIVSDPDAAIARALRNIDTMRPRVRGSAGKWLDEWEKLLAGPIEMMLAAYTARDLRGRELRQHSPFAGLLDDAERTEVLGRWREVRNRRARGGAA
jgi:excisionase family DNA binding protein